MKEKYNSAKERIKIEFWNALTHGIGVVLGIVFLVMLIIQSVDAGNSTAIVAYSIYGACFILMFLMSTLYHSIQHPKVKKVFRLFDHISIYYFIAGSFTPAILLLTNGWRRIVFLVIIWTIAIIGTIYKVLTFKKLDKYKSVSVIIYVAMGWMAVLFIRPIVENNLWRFGLLMLIGGLLYTAGTFFYKSDKFKYNHVIWHLFVLSAAIVHFRAFYLYL